MNRNTKLIHGFPLLLLCALPQQTCSIFSLFSYAFFPFSIDVKRSFFFFFTHVAILNDRVLIVFSSLLHLKLNSFTSAQLECPGKSQGNWQRTCSIGFVVVEQLLNHLWQRNQEQKRIHFIRLKISGIKAFADRSLLVRDVRNYARKNNWIFIT